MEIVSFRSLAVFWDLPKRITWLASQSNLTRVPGSKLPEAGSQQSTDVMLDMLIIAMKLGTAPGFGHALQLIVEIMLQMIQERLGG